MSLKQTLAEFAIPSFRPLPKRSAVSDAHKKICEEFGIGGELATPPDLDKIAGRLQRALQLQQFEMLGRRERQYGPLCIFAGSRPLCDHPPALEAYLGALSTYPDRTAIRSLARVYFAQFDPGNDVIKQVGSLLALVVNKRFRVLHEFQCDYGVFDVVEGPRNIARECLQKNQLPQELLSKYGLAGDSAIAGFGAEVFRLGMLGWRNHLAKKANTKVAQIAAIKRVVDWLDEPASPYVDANVNLAKTMLMPFVEVSPEEDVKDKILDIISDRIGDPRTQPQAWARMTDAADVARRWLTRLAIRQFLEIVDETAFAGHWEYRRAFWLSVYEKANIQDAWVAFGSSGAQRAKSQFGKNVAFGKLNQGTGKFGRFAKQVQSGHAVLFLKIGDYTIADWSHDGRLIIWQSDDERAPKLYERRYDSGDLAPKNAPPGGLQKTHVSPDTYSWQRDVAHFLRNNCGVRMSENEYRVGRR